MPLLWLLCAIYNLLCVFIMQIKGCFIVDFLCKRIYNNIVTLGGKMELINSSVITAEEIVNKTLAHKNRKSMVWYILLILIDKKSANHQNQINIVQSV